MVSLLYISASQTGAQENHVEVSVKHASVGPSPRKSDPVSQHLKLDFSTKQVPADADAAGPENCTLTSEGPEDS